MYTKQDDKLVQVIPQPDLVVSLTRGEIAHNIEWARNTRDQKQKELAEAEAKLAEYEEMEAKFTELEVAELAQVSPENK